MLHDGILICKCVMSKERQGEGERGKAWPLLRSEDKLSAVVEGEVVGKCRSQAGWPEDKNCFSALFLLLQPCGISLMLEV